jgi:hypothetical protein
VARGWDACWELSEGRPLWWELAPPEDAEDTPADPGAEVGRGRTVVSENDAPILFVNLV